VTASAIDRAVRELLTELRIPPVPPIDVEALARRIGIRAVEEASLVEDGRLEVGSDSIRLLVRTGLTPPRRRFTIAHELGHLLLMDRREGAVARRLRSVSCDIERLCDHLAAAILMPRDWVTLRFAHRPRNLSAVRHLSHQTRTSMSAATARLVEILEWPVSLLRWRNEGGRWRFIAGAGVPQWLHGHLRSAPTTSSVIDSLGARTRRDSRGSLPLLVFDQVVEVDAQLSVRGTSALVLVDIRAAQSHLVRAARISRSSVRSSSFSGRVAYA
jgi:hypothetical protein